MLLCARLEDERLPIPDVPRLGWAVGPPVLK